MRSFYMTISTLSLITWGLQMYLDMPVGDKTMSALIFYGNAILLKLEDII